MKRLATCAFMLMFFAMPSKGQAQRCEEDVIPLPAPGQVNTPDHFNGRIWRWRYSVKRLEHLGRMASIVTGVPQNVDSYLKRNNPKSCKNVFIAGTTGHGGTITRWFSEILFHAAFFSTICPKYQIDEDKMAELTLYFEIIRIIDGYEYVKPYNLSIGSDYEVNMMDLKKKIKSETDCDTMYSRRFKYAYIIN